MTVPDVDRSYVSREEWESFDRNVSKSFRELGDAVRDLRREISALANKGTDWRAIISGVGVFATVLSLVGGLVAYGLNARMDTNQADIRDLQVSAAAVAQTRYTRSDADRDIKYLGASMNEHVTKLEDQFRDHISNGHPYTVLDKIDDLKRRVSILEEIERDEHE